MLQTKTKVWTYEEYYRLDDEKRHEIIEGELVEVVPTPYYDHQDLLNGLSFQLNLYNKKNKVGKIIFSPIDIVFNENNTLQPDLILILKENYSIIQKRGIFGSPDLVVEILSESTKHIDKTRKYSIYERFGVREYWIVDPTSKTFEIFALVQGKYHLFYNGNRLQSKLFPDLAILFDDLSTGD